jgi:hypothetical protein
MRMQQQQQHDHQGSSNSSGSSWGKLFAGGAAAAGAAAAGWAVWSESDAVSRAQALAEESNRAGLPRCSVATQVSFDTFAPPPSSMEIHQAADTKGS